MRAWILGLVVLVSACDTPAPTAGNAPAGAQQAMFSAYPTEFFDRARAACLPPASLVQPSNNEVRCESLPDPQSLAAIILEFDGSVEVLPMFVIAISGRDVQDGYLVTTDSYIRVPQRSGDVRQIRFPDPDTTRMMQAILQAEGGQILREK